MIRYFTIEAQWVHVESWAKSDVLGHAAKLACFVRSGHYVYFASDNRMVIEKVAQMFEITELQDKPLLWDERPYHALGNVDVYF